MEKLCLFDEVKSLWFGYISFFSIQNIWEFPPNIRAAGPFEIREEMLDAPNTAEEIQPAAQRVMLILKWCGGGRGGVIP